MSDTIRTTKEDRQAAVDWYVGRGRAREFANWIELGGPIRYLDENCELLAEAFASHRVATENKAKEEPNELKIQHAQEILELKIRHSDTFVALEKYFVTGFKRLLEGPMDYKLFGPEFDNLPHTVFSLRKKAGEQ